MLSPFGMLVLGLLAFAGGLLVLWLAVSLLFGVPRQAWQRGHGFWSWFVIQIVALNPVYPLVALAMLPDRAKGRLRRQYAAELDAKLGPGRPAPTGAGAAIPDRSVGDLPTLAPPGRSVGDAPTV
jgi:hypothetical protein